MMNHYLSILEDSMKKKVLILRKIQEYNEKQREIFQSGQARLEDFDGYVDEKDSLIRQINQLDEGFEALYAKVGEELKGNKEKYAGQITSLKQLVTQVTEMSVTIQAQEARNKKLVESYFAKERENIKSSRQTSKAAMDYYKNMNKTNIVQPQFMDKKK